MTFIFSFKNLALKFIYVSIHKSGSKFFDKLREGFKNKKELVDFFSNIVEHATLYSSERNLIW